ncbi:hypothetical protein AAMO2058_000077400 [Amorphochlora amoebiformis]|mmetsp:Transcript_22086/g.34761  ORF Transcript_22086/g.34761 Transcript_22086/m.34761 type:complete len:729 (-) Transcript_22086:333-2519(-)
MAEIRRHGNSDASTSSTLQGLWVLTALEITTQVVASVYTQTNLHLAELKGVKIQMIGSAYELDFILLMVLLFPMLSMLISGAANHPVDCGAYIFITQFFACGIVAILMYRALRFTFHVAQRERTKHYIRYGSEAGKRIQLGAAEKRKLDYANWISSHFNEKGIIAACCFVFIVCLLALPFAEPENVRWANGKGNSCRSRTATYAVGGWFVWVIPYLCFLHRFKVEDPYRIQFKLTIQSIALITTVFLFFVLNLNFEPELGTSQYSLTLYSIYFVFYMIMWGVESVMPLYLTRQKIALSQVKGPIQNHDLADTLARPELLQLFEDHLLEEWASENLEFYKEAVLYRLQANRLKRAYGEAPRDPIERNKRLRHMAERLAKRAIRIYTVYVAPGASHWVNLSAKTVEDIENVLDEPFIEKIAETLSSVHSFESHRSFAGTYERPHTPNEKRGSGSSNTDEKSLGDIRTPGGSPHRVQSPVNTNRNPIEKPANGSQIRWSNNSTPRPSRLGTREAKITTRMGTGISPLASRSKIPPGDLTSGQSNVIVNPKPSVEPRHFPAIAEGLPDKKTTEMNLRRVRMEKNRRFCSAVAEAISELKVVSQKELKTVRIEGLEAVRKKSREDIEMSPLKVKRNTSNEDSQSADKKRESGSVDQQHNLDSGSSRGSGTPHGPLRMDLDSVMKEVVQSFRRLIKVFDPAQMEIYKLMDTDSHRRFLLRGDAQRAIRMNLGQD